MATKYSSPLFKNDSDKKCDIPLPIKASRSISPIRNPPSFARPSTDCLVKTVRGPVPL